jgi:hypothetical protein
VDEWTDKISRSVRLLGSEAGVFGILCGSPANGLIHASLGLGGSEEIEGLGIKERAKSVEFRTGISSQLVGIKSQPRFADLSEFRNKGNPPCCH